MKRRMEHVNPSVLKSILFETRQRSWCTWLVNYPDSDKTIEKILEADEIEAVYGLPVFDDEDRAFYLALSPMEKEVLSQLHGPKSSIYCILQLGYFKARQQFFVFNLQQVAADAEYVQSTYFPD